jgi:hypothetical protein
MVKKYIKKVIQYSLEGKKLNVYKNANEASKITNYDSIINCCLNKYKTAGGYVWRFEGEPFSVESKKLKTNTFKCKICSSEENPRSMSMHLKWAHSMNTDEYVALYGEFRPKILKNIESQKTSKIKCNICNVMLNSNQHLMYHITKYHPNITKSEYIIDNILHNTPLCKCGCGSPVTILENGKNCDLKKITYHRDYIKGHWDWEVFTGIGKQSKEEIQLIEFIKEIYNDDIQLNVRGLIPKLEIDIYLPKIKIAIEYNGLYWHSEKNGKKSDYHINKTKLLQKLDIRLIQIFSDEWINKNEIVKNKLKSIIIKEKPNKIHARKCMVKEINPNIKNKFLNENHIQGEDRSSIKLGLYHDEELVSVMTFSSPRVALGGDKQLKNIYELSRFASKTYVVGGSNKLLSFFIKKYNPIEIYSYSDNRWTDPNNNMYLKLGFTKQNTSNPNYWYTKTFTERLHRYNFNKFRLKSMGADISKTEKNIMESLGYTRIWDCGTTKYVLKIKFLRKST